jgi:arsenate reductase
MAEGYLKSLDNNLDVYSAGTSPALEVHPKAIRVMAEEGIDLRSHKPKMVDKFLKESLDYVITVCGDAKENCPVFLGNVKERLHIGFEDPAKATGSEEEILQEFRRIRDEIKEGFHSLYKDKLQNQ